MLGLGRSVDVVGRLGGIHRKTRCGKGGRGGGGLGCTRGVDKGGGEGILRKGRARRSR